MVVMVVMVIVIMAVMICGVDECRIRIFFPTIVIVIMIMTVLMAS
jgi:hypothetical protein